MIAVKMVFVRLSKGQSTIFFFGGGRGQLPPRSPWPVAMCLVAVIAVAVIIKPRPSLTRINSEKYAG